VVNGTGQGYLRRLGFEVPGGGFDWSGNPPANPLSFAEQFDSGRLGGFAQRLSERCQRQMPPDCQFQIEHIIARQLVCSTQREYVSESSSRSLIVDFQVEVLDQRGKLGDIFPANAAVFFGKR
jgi:hypothetical protein